MSEHLSNPEASEFTITAKQHEALKARDTSPERFVREQVRLSKDSCLLKELCAIRAMLPEGVPPQEIGETPELVAGFICAKAGCPNPLLPVETAADSQGTLTDLGRLKQDVEQAQVSFNNYPLYTNLSRRPM